MKLKKIASLALAGIMAVSMLAGCKDGSSSSTTTDPETTTGIVAAVNNGQDKTNEVKVNFTSSSALTNALKGYLATKGDSVTSLTSIDLTKQLGKTYDSGNFKDDVTTTGEKIADGTVFEKIYYATPIAVGTNYPLNEDAALEMLVEKVDDVVNDLKAQSAKVQQGEEFYKYEYTGEISDLVSVKTSEGKTYYFAAYTIAQTVTKAKAA